MNHVSCVIPLALGWRASKKNMHESYSINYLIGPALLVLVNFLFSTVIPLLLYCIYLSADKHRVLGIWTGQN